MADEFNPEYLQGGYSRRDAFAFAAACDLAYQIKPASAIVEATLKQQWGFTDVTIINKYLGGRIDTQGFVAANEGNILVAFAGSESFSDWWANVTFIAEPGPFKETKVHKGFKDALVPTLVRIAADSQKYNLNGEKKIWVAGHSLGGALAVLLTATLLADGIPVAGLYTYGAPRVGNS
ncbi:MAG TPA: lipase family protein, partial [Candidatus Obscuribacterales bacterium]